VEAPREPLLAGNSDRSRRHARRRSLVLFAVLVVLLHAVLLGSADWASLGPEREPAAGTPMAVRSIEARPDPADTEPAAVARPPPSLPKPPRPPKPRRPRVAASPSAEASARPVEPPSPVASEPVVAEAENEPPPAASAPAIDAANAAPVPAPAPSQAAPEVAIAASAPASAAPLSFLGAGEMPPPTYRTKLPPSVTLRYEVRRGFLRGTGEIRWQRVGDDFGLRLEARIAGLTLLAQTSQGVVDATGLAPVRFLDQRARRTAQAANFRRDAGTITFSGASVVWPLLPGTQDQLSWMIQLAGIVAAEPERASAGGSISMVIVGARGEAGVRTLRYAGREDAQTASGTVPALKFVVDSRSAYDSGYEIWLDPAHDYLPAHATRRNGAGESEFDLLLERIEPIS
jgi:hypothetical protein